MKEFYTTGQGYVGVVYRVSLLDRPLAQTLFFYLFQVVCGTSSGFADCLSLFAILRFFAGAGNAGCLLVRYVYCMELVTTKHRTAAGFLCNIFVSLGFTTLSLFAYLIRDWRYLMLAVTIPAAPLIFFWK
jgi:OCT family organic cation transporter-like MFS transporter 4/5